MMTGMTEMDLLRSSITTKTITHNLTTTKGIRQPNRIKIAKTIQIQTGINPTMHPNPTFSMKKLEQRKNRNLKV